jgi:hypothetical protein
MNKEFIIVVYKLEAKISRRIRSQNQKNTTKKNFQPKRKLFKFFLFLSNPNNSQTHSPRTKTKEPEEEKIKIPQRKILNKKKTSQTFFLKSHKHTQLQIRNRSNKEEIER